MACNNTTYIKLLMNNTELQYEYYETAFYVGILNYNIPAAMTVNKIVTPVWVFIGIFGNIISAMIWANPRMRTCNTAAYYLTCLSIADLTFLILCFIYELQNPWLLGTLDVFGWCQIYNVLNMAVQYFCVFLVFAFTVERFLSMCFPFKSERFGKTRTPRIISCLLGLAILLGLPQLYFWEIQSLVGECQLGSNSSNKSVVSFFSIYTWCTEIAVFGILPLVVLVLNVAVLYKIRHAGKLDVGASHQNGMTSYHAAADHRASLLVSEQDAKATRHTGRTNGGHKASSNKGTTVTLLWVSFFLILTMLPNTVVYAMQALVPYGFMPCRVQDMAGDVSSIPFP
ncbi:type-1b angiotensin ii receptor [Plakobranchus ocellatus]|uniref:Type-1b angiotensin ii receptor n=1 Tax=Plakobranchus ocellatus TaxID=259542 RepID=A0AAV4DKT5_9GAST|nr:type-1b angiotensin ii receptor [Plakobranchus ocellatus]